MSQAASILEKRRSVGSLTGDWQWVVTVDYTGYLLSFCESSGLLLLDHRLRLPCMQDRCLICGYQQESCLRWMLNCSDLLKLRNFWAQLKIQHELPQEHWCSRLWCLQILDALWFHEEMGRSQWLDIWLIAGHEQSAGLSQNPSYAFVPGLGSSWRRIGRNCSRCNGGLPKWHKVGSSWLTRKSQGSWVCPAFLETRLTDKLVTKRTWWAATKTEDPNPSW